MQLMREVSSKESRKISLYFLNISNEQFLFSWDAFILSDFLYRVRRKPYLSLRSSIIFYVAISGKFKLIVIKTEAVHRAYFKNHEWTQKLNQSVHSSRRHIPYTIFSKNNLILLETFLNEGQVHFATSPQWLKS